MQPISVVMIAKNEAHIIAETIKSVQSISTDIVIADTGSTDDTIAICKSLGCHVVELPWKGFGKTKNDALAFAKNNWVLFLDADEELDTAAQKAIAQLDLSNDKIVYKLQYNHYIGKRRVRHGEWRSFSKIRLFNKAVVHWDDSIIHEQLVLPAGTQQVQLGGVIMHHVMKDLKEYADKMNSYAESVAQKYYEKGKKANFFKLYCYPCYEFFMNYIFRLAFLDGWLGFTTSFFSAYYVFYKYHRLKELCSN